MLSIPLFLSFILDTIASGLVVPLRVSTTPRSLATEAVVEESLDCQKIPFQRPYMPSITAATGATINDSMLRTWSLEALVSWQRLQGWRRKE
ncbi:hypothetical protein BDP81DRAFT_19171 [Colletotrichum phormii]|uniref:Secreted protein n=1 Tax=Colletotrichum phormii TaxID=359342 RepID=A0AAJ0EKC6_9PEZI|nr:uncharacterized protein BDP81DRAFT_19171 [Colletotrichum phormii]KAK1656280.1 hypothetical protein BDP81DRAFT_19171 [Colletotrichum phormii]